MTRRQHKQAVRSAFDRAAASYDGAAAVQREICHRLAGFAATAPCGGTPRRVLDAGCGTGYGLGLLASLCPQAELFALDFAPAMLARLASGRPEKTTRGTAPGLVCGDLEALPLAGGTMDAVWSSLALQWCDPALALGEIARVLRPGGVAWLATLGPATLCELRAAFAAVDDAEHVIRFHPLERWREEAARAGLDEAAAAAPRVHALAPDLRRLLRDIKAIGAHSVGGGPRPALTRAHWRRLESRYEAHRRPDGMLPATYDLILLALRKR
ncbi:methyltransferase domain-containing protein [Thauera sinica]|uniref:Malonyl-[acyl-carrier protein] O-methyltransferase n=1 Tax=Thauera sinica TaxID=2665146 RepID=A0ABW1AVK6_9RHOO|nr:methyltransferase domain-containing protein [Thauera sp. K11]